MDAMQCEVQKSDASRGHASRSTQGTVKECLGSDSAVVEVLEHTIWRAPWMKNRYGTHLMSVAGDKHVHIKLALGQALRLKAGRIIA